MTTRSPWQISEPDAATILQRYPDPLHTLARAEVPALVFRQAFAPTACQALMRRLVREELLYDPGQPAPEAFRERAIRGLAASTPRVARTSPATEALACKDDRSRAAAPVLG